MAEIGDYLKLSDIVKKAKNSIISLPTVQRGFVWRPYQIENLWDSLLRGYPVGSFVLSRKTDSTEEYELLDGQQRASAICLGFHNPLKQLNDNSNPVSTYFRTSSANIMIFIDLAKPNGNYDNRKYLFRVITKSHPWGYRIKENQKTLESYNRTKAMSCYDLENYEYLKKPLNSFWPFDAYKPIPIGIFVDAAINKKDAEEVKTLISESRYGKKLEVLNNDRVDSYSIPDIYYAVQNMLDTQKVPILLLDMQKIYGSNDCNNGVILKENIDANQLELEDDNGDTNAHIVENEQPNC